MLRRKELKRNDKKESAQIPCGYWSRKGALCQSDTESSVEGSWAWAGAEAGPELCLGGWASSKGCTGPLVHVQA